MTPDEAVAVCRQAGVRLVRFLYCDNGGIVRAKAAHVERLADRWSVSHDELFVMRFEFDSEQGMTLRDTSQEP